jgi:hypothetical protein
MPRHSLRGLLTALQGCSAGSSLVPCLVERLELLSLCIETESAFPKSWNRHEGLFRPAVGRFRKMTRQNGPGFVAGETMKVKFLDTAPGAVPQSDG